jgi:hypothetical protein
LRAKTPSTINFAAKIQAIHDAYPKPTENYSDSPAPPLALKSCPPKQTQRALFEQDPAAMLKKSLFKDTRKSLGAALTMTWED